MKNEIETKEELLEMLFEEPKTREYNIRGFEDRIASLWSGKENRTPQFDNQVQDDAVQLIREHQENDSRDSVSARLRNIEQAAKDFRDIQF